MEGDRPGPEHLPRDHPSQRSDHDEPCDRDKMQVEHPRPMKPRDDHRDVQQHSREYHYRRDRTCRHDQHADDHEQCHHDAKRLERDHTRRLERGDDEHQQQQHNRQNRQQRVAVAPLQVAEP
jgi:hypothetical protein